MYPLNDKLIRQVFALDLKINQVKKEVFVDNIALFLKNSGSSLLRDDENKFFELKIFTEKRKRRIYFSIIAEKKFSCCE